MSLFGAMLATVSGLTTPTSAAVVYTHDAGVWHMIGDVEPDASDSACIFQTSLATARIQINIFPKTGIPDYVTMTLADPKGTWRPKQTMAVKTLFLGDNVDVTPFLLVATANNNEKITFRDLPLNFVSNLGHANSITLFREDPKETFIDLTGTSELLKSLDDCKASLINPPGETNVAIPTNPVAQLARSPDVVAAKPVETQQPVRTETLIQSPQPAATGFDFKEESPKQTPAQRCSINACNKECNKVWTHKLDKNGDDGAIEVNVCQELCANQKPFCLAHEGSSIEFPKIPKSDMHDLEVVYCARVNDEFCQGFK